MTEVLDPLLVRVKDDVLHHDMKAAVADAAQVLRRDTDLAHPENTRKHLSQDAQALAKAGISEGTLEQLGILPKAHFEIEAGQRGAVITDGKTSMPVSVKDATTDLAAPGKDADAKPGEHGARLGETAKKVGTDTIITYHYADGWTGQSVISEDHIVRNVEKSPDSKDCSVAVLYPDGFGMLQKQHDGVTTNEMTVYPPDKNGRVYQHVELGHGSSLDMIKDYHGLKEVPVIFHGDMQTVQDQYADRVEGEMRVMEYEKRQAGIS